MIIIGVTGKSGAGKSTVSTIIKNNTGAVVIDADRISKNMMMQGEDYFNDILKVFGEEILIKRLKHKGNIDSAKLANIIFNDKDKREQLNKLTFKYVTKKTKELILENKEKEIIVLDFPLLYEGGFNKLCNYVIGVISDDETKIVRIKERDRISKSQVEARINTQIDDKKLKQAADYIINNSKETRYISLVKDVIKIIHKIKKDEEEKNKL